MYHKQPKKKDALDLQQPNCLNKAKRLKHKYHKMKKGSVFLQTIDNTYQTATLPLVYRHSGKLSNYYFQNSD